MSDFSKMNPPDMSRYPAPPPSYYEVPPPHSQPPYPTDPLHQTNLQLPSTPYPTSTPYPPEHPYHPQPIGTPYPPEHPYHPQPIGTPYPPQPITSEPFQSITVIAPQRPLSSKSEYVTCTQCQTQGWTRVEHKSNMMTHTCAILLCCFILWPIAWLPYCCDACKSPLHYCSNCNAFVGEGTNI